jgi:peptidoglycan/LPS O-acetylase OafA/YrhL
MTAMQKDNQQEIQKYEKIEELESLRGLAAFLIVFYHMPEWNSILDIRLVKNGYLMVELFFVLSGFVIFNAYSGKINTKKDLVRFQFLRFGRLYPVHLLFLIIFLGIEIAKYIASIKLGINIISKPFEINNFSSFLKHIFLISSVLPNQPFSFNCPAWSISVEFYTYLVFAVIILIVKKRYVLFFTAFSFVSLVMLVTKNTFGFELMLRCLAGFFIGCLTANFTKSIKVHLPNLFSVIVLLVTISFLQLKTTKDFDFLIYFLTALLIVTLVLSKNGILKTILRFKFLTWLGSVSYSVYMSHYVIEWLVNASIRRIFKKHEIIKDFYYVSDLSQHETLFACFVVVAIVLAISYFVYNFIEKPMREMSRRFAFSRLK